MTDRAPLIWWIRRDLRLADNAVLEAISQEGRPVVPLYILDEQEEALGAAPKFRLGLGLERFARSLEAVGSRLIFRRGAALQVLEEVLTETKADGVCWARLYDPQAIARDTAVKTALSTRGLLARSFDGHLLFEPWQVETKAGGMFKVYTPFWKALRDRSVAPLRPAPARLSAPPVWPRSDRLSDWGMADAMHKAADVVAQHCRVGEAAAQARLDHFTESCLERYKADRDHPALPATSRLSENLAWGEISPQRLWYAAQRAEGAGKSGAEHFRKEVVWREFAYHLMYHTPHILHANWRESWDRFPWRTEPAEAVENWRRGQTGYDFIDAAMRELYVTGTMHNRARMLVGSFLTKHMLIHWRVGMEWFADCLIDWDPASNAMGWQWVAGSGPDAAPFFRIFNPEGQRAKFDAQNHYVHSWIAEGMADPSATALSFFDAAPTAWGMSPADPRPPAIVDLAAGRERALQAYRLRDAAQQA